MLGFFDRLANRLKVVPRGMTNVPWASIHTAFTKGEVGILLTGGIWHWGEWSTKYRLTEDYMWENIGWALIPAGSKGGKPVSVSHPLAYVIPAEARNPGLGFLIVTLATSTDLNTRHAIQSMHLAIRDSQIAYRAYAESKALVEFTKLLPFSRFSPNHPKTPFYWETIHKGLTGVETGQLTPDRALEFIVDRLKWEIGDELIVR
jgi:inositol-phosphate transport system substrate-binding protein